jgi:hypothetical protein
MEDLDKGDVIGEAFVLERQLVWKAIEVDPDRETLESMKARAERAFVYGRWYIFDDLNGRRWIAVEDERDLVSVKLLYV